MKNLVLNTAKVLIVGAVGFVLLGCKTPVRSTAKGVGKAAKVSAKATVEGAKATGRAVKNTAGAVVGK